MIETVERAANILKKMGAESYDVYAVSSEGTTVEAKDGKVEKIRLSAPRGMAIRVLIDGRLGFSYTNDVSEDGIRIAIECAKENALSSEPDDYLFSIPEEVELSFSLEDGDFFHISTERKIELALELEERARSYSPKIKRVRKASYSDSRTTVYYYNSNGHSFSYTTTSYSLSTLVAAEEDDSSQMGWDYQGKRYFSELNPIEVAVGAASSAVELLGAKPMKTLRLPVIFKNSVFAQLIEALSGAFLGITSGEKSRSLQTDSTPKLRATRSTSTMTPTKRTDLEVLPMTMRELSRKRPQ